MNEMKFDNSIFFFHYFIVNATKQTKVYFFNFIKKKKTVLDFSNCIFLGLFN